MMNRGGGCLSRQLLSAVKAMRQCGLLRVGLWELLLLNKNLLKFPILA
jgi:hypothetical protein